MKTQTFDVIIIGAGAAGLFCAQAATKRGRKVLILEHNRQVGRKILISGGGRCNFTNIDTGAENFHSSNPHFAKSALSRFSPWDFIDLVEKHQIPYFEKKLGQQFCKNSAKDIIDLLIKEIDPKFSHLELGAKIKNISKGEHYNIALENGEVFNGESLVLATGGLSIPTIGATDLGYQVAKMFGHEINETVPALVPFTLDKDLLKKTNELSGVSLDVKVVAGERVFEESLLFTHKGLSGPVILQASLFWKHGEEVEINFLPNENFKPLEIKKTKGAVTLNQFFKPFFPKRFLENWMGIHRIDGNEKMGEISNKSLEDIFSLFTAFKFIPNGTEGYRKAEVTRGGISTNKVSSKTMESQLSPGLYFIGECLDVTGQLGGFNFQWAWASANAAGQFV